MPFFLSLLLTALFFPALSYANDVVQSTGDLEPELVRAKALRQIPDLTWNAAPEKMSTLRLNGETVQVGVFRGTVPSLKGSSILYFTGETQRVARVSDTDGSVEILVPITESEVLVRLRAVDNYGAVYEDAVSVSSTFSEKWTGRKLNFDLGIGMSYLAYTEHVGSSKFEITEMGITPKAGLNYRLSEKFELGGNAFITAVPIKLSSGPEALLVSRWYGVNARIGYRIAQLSPRASLHFLAGYYVWGMITPVSAPTLIYGVSRLGGPQIFLAGRFRTESKRVFSLYVKAASIQDGGGISTTNRELAMGGSFQITPFNGVRRRILLSLDLADARYLTHNQDFNLRSMTVGVGTNF